MSKQPLIHEVFWLRCIACLAVTFGHGIQNGYLQFTEASSYHTITYILYMAILFGVPVFVFISEFLLANKYAAGVPKGFLKKRLQILLMPYVFMNIVYALFTVETWTLTNFLIRVSRNIFLGESSIYFVLIIFQFYLLHMLCSKYLNRLSPKIVLPVTFVINFAYLGFFNFVEAPDHVVAAYLWNPGYWMPFLGWIFYLALGFYCGRNYQTVLSMLRKYRIVVFAMPVITFMIMLFMNKYFLIDQSSKRVDMLLFASSMIFLVMYVSSMIKQPPKIVMVISNYSFSIFLINPFFFLLLLNLKPPAFLNVLSYSILAFIVSTVLSIGTSYVLNKTSIGKYIVGQNMNFKIEPIKNNGEALIRSHGNVK